MDSQNSNKLRQRRYTARAIAFIAIALATTPLFHSCDDMDPDESAVNVPFFAISSNNDDPPHRGDDRRD
jgi:hypothetical protein